MARRPKRSDSFAISGVPMRFVSTYALKIHDPSRESSPNSASMAGSAGPTIAMSRAPMSTPTNSTATVRLRCLSSTRSPNRAVSQESRTNGSPIANQPPASVAEVAARTVVERENEVEHHGAGGRQRDDCRGHDRERRNDDGPVERELYVAGAPPEPLLREQSHRVEAAEARLVTEQDERQGRRLGIVIQREQDPGIERVDGVHDEHHARWIGRSGASCSCRKASVAQH